MGGGPWRSLHGMRNVQVRKGQFRIGNKSMPVQWFLFYLPTRFSNFHCQTTVTPCTLHGTRIDLDAVVFYAFFPSLRLIQVDGYISYRRVDIIVEEVNVGLELLKRQYRSEEDSFSK